VRHHLIEEREAPKLTAHPSQRPNMQPQRMGNQFNPGTGAGTGSSG